MNKYFKYKYKYTTMVSDMHMLFVLSELWSELWKIKGMDEMFNKARKKTKKHHTTPKTKKSTKKTS